MLPPRFAPFLFGLILSAMVSFVISGIATIRALGFVDGVLMKWIWAWSASWPVAFTLILILAPVTRKLVATLIRSPEGGQHG